MSILAGLRAAACVASVVLVCEAATRWFLAAPARLDWIASAIDEPSWRLRWVQRHASGELVRSFDVPHPTRGWALAPGLHDLPVFDGKLLNSNSRGLRGGREYVTPKPAGVRRIVVFGDSFAFGEEVGDRETFASVLEDLLPGVEVLNFGVHGYGHDQMLLYLREAAARYDPDLVLLAYVAEDAPRNILAFRDFAKPRFALRGGALELTGVPVPSPSEVLSANLLRPRLVDLAEMAYERAAWASGIRKREMNALTVAILDAFFADVRSLGARPVVAYLPVQWELSSADPAPTPAEEHLADLCRARGVAFVDLHPTFAEQRAHGVALETQRHWQPLEHRLAAESLATFLRDEIEKMGTASSAAESRQPALPDVCGGVVAKVLAELGGSNPRRGRSSSRGELTSLRRRRSRFVVERSGHERLEAGEDLADDRRRGTIHRAVAVRACLSETRLIRAADDLGRGSAGMAAVSWTCARPAMAMTWCATAGHPARVNLTKAWSPL